MAKEPFLLGVTPPPQSRIVGFVGGLNTTWPAQRIQGTESPEMKNVMPYPISLWRKRWGSKRMTTSAAAAAWTTVVAPAGALRVQHIGAGSLGDNVLVFRTTTWYYEAIS